MTSKVLLSYYDILGVARDADDGQIKRAYREKAEIYHPDKVFHLGELQQRAAEMEMKLINNAREILLDPEQREQYDLYLDGALDVEEVLEPFIIVDEFNENRSPLWKKVTDMAMGRVEKRMKQVSRMADTGTVVEPLDDDLDEDKEGDEGCVEAAMVVEPMDEGPLTKEDCSKEAEKSKKKPFKVLSLEDDGFVE